MHLRAPQQPTAGEYPFDGGAEGDRVNCDDISFVVGEAGEHPVDRPRGDVDRVEVVEEVRPRSVDVGAEVNIDIERPDHFEIRLDDFGR